MGYISDATCTKRRHLESTWHKEKPRTENTSLPAREGGKSPYSVKLVPWKCLILPMHKISTQVLLGRSVERESFTHLYCFYQPEGLFLLQNLATNIIYSI